MLPLNSLLPRSGATLGLMLSALSEGGLIIALEASSQLDASLLIPVGPQIHPKEVSLPLWYPVGWEAFKNPLDRLYLMSAR